MDIRKLKKLIELVEESEIDELEIRDADESVRIARRRPDPAAGALQLPMASAGAPVQALPAAPVHQTPAQSAAQVPAGDFITAPMVGTYYHSASPGAKPFVSVGDRIQPGDTLCIIEAMKILNQIEADRAGTIRAVLVEDGQPVEFGQPLFALEPD